MSVQDEINYSLKGKQVSDIVTQIKGNHHEIGRVGQEVSTKQDALTSAQLDAANSGIDSTKVAQIATNASDIATEATTRANADTALTTQVGLLGQRIVAEETARENADRVLQSDVSSLQTRMTTAEGDIDSIEEKIPAQASAQNQLADKSFVNSSIASNTATFRGSYNLVSDLNLTTSATESQVATALASAISTAQNNDYAFVQVPVSDVDPTVISRVDRYKYNGSAWEFEYSLNNSSFTASQWAAINSGVTSGDVSKLAGIQAGAEVNTIDSISVNGVAQTPDANKNVDLTIDRGIKTLTTADYNYPTTGTKTAIAPWLLTSGIYKMTNGTAIVTNILAGGVAVTGDTILLVSKKETNTLLYIQRDNNVAEYMTFNSAGDRLNIETNLGSYDLVTGIQVVDNLTSAYTRNPLSANQGRILGNRIESRIKTWASAPTAYVPGSLGQLLLDTTNAKLYQLTAIDTSVSPNTYIWTEIGAGGGGPTVVQTTGTSTTNVMSQDATTKMVYPFSSSQNAICIGGGANTVPNYSIAIGPTSSVVSVSSIALGHTASVASSSDTATAIGYAASAKGIGSIAIGREAQTTTGLRGQIALGSFSSCSQVGEMNIGSSNTAHGYSSSNYRLLTGVYDGQNAHDAATKGQVDAVAATVPTAFTTNEWNAMWA